MSYLQISSGIPVIGYPIQFAIWLVATWFSVKMIIRLYRKWKFRSVKLYLALALFLLCVSCAIANTVYSLDIDWNPRFSNGQIFGTWEDGESSFILADDGRANLNLSGSHQQRLGVQNGPQSWKRPNDFEIEFFGRPRGAVIQSEKIGRSGRRGNLRVIMLEKEFRMIIDDFGDPDFWDGDLGFVRAK